MKKLIPVLTLLTLVFLTSLIFGCTSQNTTPSSGTGVSACSSPYDGTYSGTVSGSGEFWHTQTLQYTPYIYTYNLEVTFKCEQEATGWDNKTPLWLLDVTHAKVSDSYFDCTNGCTITNEGMERGEIEIYPPGVSPASDPQRGLEGLSITFPNERGFQIAPIIADSDAKTIRADQSEHADLISSSILGMDYSGSSSGVKSFIEYSLCKDNDCLAPKQEGVTMTLVRIS